MEILPAGLVSGFIASIVPILFVNIYKYHSLTPFEDLWRNHYGQSENPKRYQLFSVVFHLTYGLLAGIFFGIVVGHITLQPSILLGLLTGLSFGLILFGLSLTFWVYVTFGSVPNGKDYYYQLFFHLLYGGLLGLSFATLT